MTQSFQEQIPYGSLIVSCQATGENPLRSGEAMALMARAATSGGAAAIRANGTEDVGAIRSVVDLPIVGINKLGDRGGVFITPTSDAALAVVEAGASIVALDGTARRRPDGNTLAEQIRRIRTVTDVPLMADVDSLRSGLFAREAGADAVATTLSGYVDTVRHDEPDIALVAELAAELDCPVVAEGRLRTADDVRAAHAAGAHAVVVGTALTNPMENTRRLVLVLHETDAERTPHA